MVCLIENNLLRQNYPVHVPKNWSVKHLTDMIRKSTKLPSSVPISLTINGRPLINYQQINMQNNVTIRVMPGMLLGGSEFPFDSQHDDEERRTFQHAPTGETPNKRLLGPNADLPNRKSDEMHEPVQSAFALKSSKSIRMDTT